MSNFFPLMKINGLQHTALLFYSLFLILSTHAIARWITTVEFASGPFCLSQIALWNFQVSSVMIQSRK